MSDKPMTPIDKIISEYINCRELEGDEDPDGELIHSARMCQKEMQDAIAALKADNERLTARVRELEADNATKQNSIWELEETVSGLESKLNASKRQ